MAVISPRDTAIRPEDLSCFDEEQLAAVLEMVRSGAASEAEAFEEIKRARPQVRLGCFARRNF